MRTIKLNLLLMLLVVLAGFIALLVSAGLILHQADSSSRNRTDMAAQVAKQQLELQLHRIDNQFDFLKHFPDFHLWQKSSNHAGLCVSYRNSEGEILRSLCLGDISEEVWPQWFAGLYQGLFTPAQEVVRDVLYKGQVQGQVRVSPSLMVELSRAWDELIRLMGFAVLIVSTLCLLLYLTLHLVLRPVRQTQLALAGMLQQDLSIRVPPSRIAEWQETGQAINQLAASLQHTLDERRQLALKLVDLQEQERRYLSRELHDELGQSLAGLSAVARSMRDEASQNYPPLQEGADQVARISRHLMELVKGLLLRLRPADLDELGLAESLRGLVGEWNSKHQHIECELALTGDVDRLPSPVAVNLLRIVQECLTNISRHSGADRACVCLDYPASGDSVLGLTISDNGTLGPEGFVDKPGQGLLGIRERITALDGELQLQTATSGGLQVSVTIPVNRQEQTHADS